MFYNQPVIGVRNENKEIESAQALVTSYLFIPKIGEEEELWLPDLEVVRVIGRNSNKVTKIIHTIADLYTSEGWTSCIIREFGLENRVVTPQTNRYEKIKIATTESLIGIATKHGYDPNHLYFDL